MLDGNMQIVGLKEALRELNQLNPKFRREVTKDFQKICKPVIETAKQNLPTRPPMSGWAKGWKTPSGFEMLPPGGWSGAAANKFIKAKVSGKRPRQYAGRMQDATVFMIRFAGMVNTVFSVAGRDNPQGNSEAGAQMIRVLEHRYGKPSRVLWPAYEANKAEVEREVMELTRKVMAEVGRDLK